MARFRSLDEILDSLGGESAVATMLGCGPSSVSNWKSRGLPKGRWVDLVTLGAERGVRPPISLDEVRRAAVAIESVRQETA
jgi:DNA-binding transcriptional regulator YdaS (Cro superfamily)